MARKQRREDTGDRKRRREDTGAKTTAANVADIFILAVCALTGAANVAYFAVHVSFANFAAIFVGDADSLLFMGATGAILLTVSALSVFFAVKKRSFMTRARSSLPYRRARAALVLGAAAFVVGELAIFSFGAMTRPDTVAPPSLEYALVLGAHVRNDGPSNILKNRLDAALVYMNANPDVVLIASGGQGADEPTTEARAMRDYLVERGADPKRIICEERSRNTFENIANSSPLIEDGARVALITSDFHMLRAVMIARRFGMNPFVISAPTPLDVAAGCYSREFFGLIKSFLFDRPRAT